MARKYTRRIKRAKSRRRRSSEPFGERLSSQSCWRGVIERYREHLPVTDKTPVVSLKEGNTPLIFSEELSDLACPGVEVHLKFEGMNPTGSFKDRGMTLAISKALEGGSKAVLCASTGNTSASASAYAAKAGMRSIILIPSGAVALGKLSQALMHGAKMAPIDANFDACLALAKSLTQQYPVTLVNSINPYRIEGQKSGAFEICDALGRAPDFQLMPVGNAGNITAHWKGYREYRDAGQIESTPVMLGFQAQGAAPIAKGHVVKRPKTAASAIRIGNPASWRGAIDARDESGGRIEAVSDREILAAYRLLAQDVGLFAEPASAASVAGLLKLSREGYFRQARRARGARKRLVLVCVLTGHGLKDPERALAGARLPKALPPSLSAVGKAVGLKR